MCMMTPYCLSRADEKVKDVSAHHDVGGESEKLKSESVSGAVTRKKIEPTKLNLQPVAGSIAGKVKPMSSSARAGIKNAELRARMAECLLRAEEILQSIGPVYGGTCAGR